MADEDIDVSVEEDITSNNKVERRIKDLSEKVKLTATERDDLAKAKAEAEAKAAASDKERDFYKDFATSSSRYPGAADYQDAIKEKVMAGYSVEDAMVSVLNKEGKLQNNAAPAPKPASPAGGSATNQLKMDSDKPINEMSRDEKRAALMQAEAEGGDLSSILRSMQS